MRKTIVVFVMTLLVAGGLGVQTTTPAFATTAPLATPVNGCTLGAYHPDIGNNRVRGLAQIYNCNGYHHMQLQECLQQLVTGGWQNVRGSCVTLPTGGGTLYTNALGAQGKSYPATANRYYRSWGFAYVDGVPATEVSRSYQGT